MAKVVLKFETNDANGKKLEIDDGSIVSLNSLSQSSSDSSSINYGCIANTGSMTIVDFNGNIAKQIKDGTMPSSNVDVDLYINNNKIQSHITTDSTYDENTNEFNVSVTNRIADWDILKYKGYVYQNKSATLYEILSDVFSTLEDSLDDALSEIITYTYPEDGSYTSKQGTIKEYLKLISIEYPSIEYGYTIRQVIDDICTIAQLQCFIDDNDKVKFVSARPVSSEEDDIINVDKSIILEDVNEDLFVVNKYDGIELSESIVKKEKQVKTNAVVFNKTEDINYTISNMKSYFYIKEGELAGYRMEKIEYSYDDGIFRVDKTSKNGLSKILEVPTQGDNCYFTIDKFISAYTGKLKNPNQFVLDLQPYDNSNTFATTDYSKNVDFSYFASGDGDIFLGYDNTKITDESYVKVSEYEDYYEFEYHILSSTVVYNQYESISSVDLSDVDIAKYELNSFKLNIKGIVYEISFETVQSNTENIESAKTKANISLSLNLLQTQTTINGTKISDIIKHNILTDYKNGLSTAKLKVVCSDMYDKSGVLVKNWQLGKILENNNLVQLGEKVMRINSRNFIYDGSPEIELQTLEQKIIFFYGLFKDGDGVYSWNQLIDSGKIQIFETSDGNIELMYGTDTSLDGDLILPSNVISLVHRTFYNCSLLTNILLPDGLKSIGESSFGYCSSLKKIDIPNSVTYIGSGAFGDCTSLTEVTFPDSVTTIIGSTFVNCSSLTKVILPAGETEIPSDIFWKCTSLQYVKIQDTVTKIAYATFQYCTSLKHIFIPKSVTTIEALQFNTYNAPFYGSPNVVIYCEASSQQSGWQQYWNTYNRVYNQNTDEYDYLYLTVKYGYTRAQYEAEVGLS